MAAEMRFLGDLDSGREITLWSGWSAEYVPPTAHKDCYVRVHTRRGDLMALAGDWVYRTDGGDYGVRPPSAPDGRGA